MSFCTRSLRDFFSYITTVIRFGLMAFWNFLKISLTNATIRLTLSPPAVEPAQPPINMSRSKMSWLKSGHRVKSTVPNPVVVMMVDTEKSAFFIHVKRSPL